MELLKENSSWLFKASKQPLLLSICSALLLALSFPPFPTGFLSFLGFIPLLLIVETRHKSSYGFIYLAFFLWNWGCGYWIGFTAFGVDEEEKLMAFLTGFLANLANPFLMSLPFMLFVRFRKFALHYNIPYKKTLAYIALVSFWVTFEFLHFHWDLSWSWYTLGHALSYHITYIQFYEWTGVLGGTALILAINALLYECLKYFLTTKKIPPQLLYATVTTLLLPFILGLLLLIPSREVFQSSGTLNVRILQPNIDPFEKFDKLTPSDQIDVFSTLMSAPGMDSIELFLLPETAIPRYIWDDKIENENLIAPLWKIVKEKKIPMVSGFVKTHYYNAIEAPTITARKYDDGFFDMYNAALTLSPEYPTQTFEKGLFVPFVERTPFIETLPFMKNFLVELGGGYGGYARPEKIHAMQVNAKARIGTMICFESGFGDYIRKLTLDKANVLAIITNDGWWLKSSGHLQHAQFTTLRAIENRRSIVRSANTGISLAADVKGNLLHKTEYWKRTFVDAKVHLYNAETFYVRFGDYLGLIAMAICVFLCAIEVINRIKQRG